MPVTLHRIAQVTTDHAPQGGSTQWPMHIHMRILTCASVMNGLQSPAAHVVFMYTWYYYMRG